MGRSRHCEPDDAAQSVPDRSHRTQNRPSEAEPISITAQNSERASSRGEPAKGHGIGSPSADQIEVSDPGLADLKSSSPLSAGLRIVVEAVVYRVRKLEMANLAAAGAIALALRLDFLDITYRVAFAFALNILVYLNNDYIDVHLDLRSTDKDSAKTRFLAANMRAALGAQIVLTLILVAARSLSTSDSWFR